MRSIAIIPARGGSKRIPGKNIKPFAGTPIIAYAIDAALGSRAFDAVMVSTDSPEIAELARRSGAEVPFLRSAATASDHATTAEVLVEVIDAYRQSAQQFELGCCIYPCNPFLTPERIVSGQQALAAGGFDSVFSAVRYAHPVQRAFVIEAGRMRLLSPEHRHTRSQDLPAVFHDAAQFYWFRVERLLRERSLWSDNTGIVEIPEALAQDIDTSEDWKLAELKYHAWKG